MSISCATLGSRLAASLCPARVASMAYALWRSAFRRTCTATTQAMANLEKSYPMRRDRAAPTAALILLALNKLQPIPGKRIWHLSPAGSA
jgi:hypothetical protein